MYGREDLPAAGGPGTNPVRDREIKGRRRQPVVSEECGQLHHDRMSLMAEESHWNEIHSTKSPSEVSWFQDPPAESLRLVLTHSSPADSVVDVGAGASLLVDLLLDHGYEDVSVVDLSAAAVDTVRQRLAAKGASVETYVADVTTWTPSRRFRVWHDRAVFHFLVDAALQRAYVDTVARTLEPGGIVIVGTFGPTGPTSCSGLPVQRHSIESLSEAFSPLGTLVESSEETHLTPWGATQDFVWAVFRRHPSIDSSSTATDSPTVES